MDRAYSYDQVGRLAEGLSGSEARGLTSTDDIYRQSYQYNVWANLTGRGVNRFWSGGEPFSTSYVNNRDQAAVYDAEGQMTGDTGERTHTYDAAGRQATTRESESGIIMGAILGRPAAKHACGRLLHHNRADHRGPKKITSVRNKFR